ncbi:MAG: hypothetical protein H6R00_1161 [Proteobacteria bacterium]|nr:hypothetical protein [Pseudomonadota bacterium]
MVLAAFFVSKERRFVVMLEVVHTLGRSWRMLPKYRLKKCSCLVTFNHK